MRQALIIPLLILAGLGVVSLVSRPEPEESFSFISGAPSGLQSAQAYLLPVAAPAYAPVRDTSVALPIIDANIALVADVDSGRVLFEKNASVRAPIASLTKMVSALVAADLFDQAEIVTVSSGSVRVDGLKQTLYLGERMAVRDLIAMMLIESSNDAAYTLSAHASARGIDFVERMNSTAVMLGMESCVFTDPAGLDDTAFCSAHDLLRLVRSSLRTTPSLWSIMATPAMTVESADGRFVHELRSTNELLGTLDGIVGGKTGYTDGALGCLILVVKLPEKSDTLISIVLGSRGRFSDTSSLVSWTRQAYQWHSYQ